MASLTGQEVLALLTVLLPVFFGNNPTEEEVLVFLTAIIPLIGPNAPASGVIPAFRVGNKQVGPIPFGPYPTA